MVTLSNTQMTSNTICLYSSMCCCISSKVVSCSCCEKREVDPIWKWMEKNALGDPRINKWLTILDYKHYSIVVVVAYTCI